MTINHTEKPENNMHILLKSGFSFAFWSWVVWNQQGAVLFGRKWLYSSRFPSLRIISEHSDTKKTPATTILLIKHENTKILSDNCMKCWWTRSILGDWVKKNHPQTQTTECANLSKEKKKHYSHTINSNLLSRSWIFMIGKKNDLVFLFTIALKIEF